MRPVALLLAVAVALSASPAVAEESTPKQRGFLTGLGLGFLVLGGASTGLGIAGTVNAVTANAALVPYLSDGAPKAENGEIVGVLDTQRTVGIVTLSVGFAVAIGSVIAGIYCLVADAPKPPMTVTFMPTAQGGTFALSASF